MKFPFDFSITFIFRLIFPGLVLALASLPLIYAMCSIWDYAPSIEAAVPLATVFLGWIVVLADQPIYMIFEGRRFWPQWLRKLGIRHERSYLAILRKRSAELKQKGDRATALEIDLRMLDFPVGKDGEHYAEYPTRLGNLIQAYERYPIAAYRIDPVFYWYRIWVKLDKDLRDSMDQAQAIADSALYVSFAFVCAAILGLVYFLLEVLPFWPPICPVELQLVPSPPITLFLTAASLLVARGTYCVGFFAQAQYGELFKALFDQFRDKLAFVDEVSQLAIECGADPAAAPNEKWRTAARYLRWHMIKPAGESTSCTPERWRAKSR